MKKLKNKIKLFIEKLLYKHFAKKYVKKLTNKKLIDIYVEVIKVRNSVNQSKVEKWKIDISRDCLRNEIKSRGLNLYVK